MGNEPVDKAEDRLHQLEKQIRELRMTSLAGAVGVAVLCLFALFRILTGSMPQEIRTKQIVVVHENGEPGIVLAIREEHPRLSFRDDKGDLRAVFELQGEGRPVLAFLDQERRYRATFGLSDEGNPGIAFWDNEYRLRTNIKLAGGGEPALGLFGREGEEGASAVLFLSDDTGPVLNMRDITGQDRPLP